MLNQKVHILTIHIHSINKNEKDTKNAVKIKKKCSIVVINVMAVRALIKYSSNTCHCDVFQY